MADNPPYKRLFSFSGYQANKPRDPLPGPRLDIEFDNLAKYLAANLFAPNGAGNYDFHGRGLVNLRDPQSPQDATTVAWTQNFVWTQTAGLAAKMDFLFIEQDPSDIQAQIDASITTLKGGATTAGDTLGKLDARLAAIPDASVALSPGIAPAVPYSFAGFSTFTRQLIQGLAARETGPEFGQSIQLVSNGGSSNPYANFKVGQTIVMSALPGAADSWCANYSGSIQPNSGPIGQIILELDINNSNADNPANGTPGSPYTAALFISGAGSVTNDAAIIISGSSELYNDGLYFEDYSPAGKKIITRAAITDRSKSPTILYTNTAHNKGIDLSAGAFTDNPLATPNFKVDVNGSVQGKDLVATGYLKALLNTTAMPVDTGGLAVSWNRNAGTGEINYLNMLNGATVGHNFSQRTGATTDLSLMRVTSTGLGFLSQNQIIDNNCIIRGRAYTVAALPTPGLVGRIAFASNGRAYNGAGTLEAAGAGTGVHVSDRGSAWVVVGTNQTVQA